MGDVYHEQLIKRKTTVIDILTRILFILLTLSAFSISTECLEKQEENIISILI